MEVNNFNVYDSFIERFQCARKENVEFQETRILSSLIMGELHFVMDLTTCSTFDVIKQHWLILEQSVLAGKCYRLSHLLVLNSSWR